MSNAPMSMASASVLTRYPRGHSAPGARDECAARDLREGADGLFPREHVSHLEHAPTDNASARIAREPKTQP